MEEREFTIIAFSENSIGLLNRLTIIFTRRHLNIDSLTVSESAIHGVYKFTIVVRTSLSQIEKVVKQITKVVDVLKAFYHCQEEIIYQEIALYKVPTEAVTESSEIESLIRKHNARILEITPDYTAIEKTGHKDETQQLFEDMKKFEVMQFTRSGRVAVTRATRERLSEYLHKLDTEKLMVERDRV
jgi:acetolactate synthase-1/3 small subunit